MGREIYDIINDMTEVLNASQMQKLQEVLVKRLSENTVSDYLQTTNMDFLDMFLTAKHLEGCSDKTIRYYRCNIEKMLTAVIVKDTIPDEKIEILRDNCNNLRDRAMIAFLLSTGIRVGELVRLNIDDIDFSERECVVYGKGDKERKAYFDAKTKIHLLNYIESKGTPT